MSNLKSNLKNEIFQSLSNHFGIENFDEYRFGKYQAFTFKEKVKCLIKKLIQYEKFTYDSLIRKHEKNLNYTWEKLNDESKALLINILAYRKLGFTKVKLPVNNPIYWQNIEKVKQLKNPHDTYDCHFLNFVLEKFDLNPIGYEIKLYFSDIGIVIDFMLEQYAYKKNNHIIEAEKGDCVLDLGGCWGDTALYFAHKVGNKGKVISFEFIPNNIKLHEINTSLNPSLKEIIQLVKNPVSHKSGQTVYYKDNGPASVIHSKPFKEQTGVINTISIDDFVELNNIEKVDFIKMDIEGAELLALKGAIETIKKHRPKLAIAIYHNMEDFANIPKWIMDLNLNYELFIGHSTIHEEETICFAKPK